MSWSTRPPEECYLHVDKWARNHFLNPTPSPTQNFADKKDLGKIIKDEVRNNEQLMKFVSELYQAFQISRIALKQYHEKLSTVTTDLETVKEDLSEKLAESSDVTLVVSKMKTELIQSMSSMIDQKLQNLLSKPTYASALVSESVNNHHTIPPAPVMSELPAGPEVMVVGLPLSANDEGSSKICEEISKNLGDVQVQFMKVHNNKKKIIVGFPNKQEKEKGIAANKKLSEDKNCAIKSSEKMLPKLTVQNVSSEIFRGIDTEVEGYRDEQKTRVVDLILKKNPGVKALVDEGHTLKSVYLKSDNLLGKNYTVVLQVSPAIRCNLINEQGGRLFISNQCYPFSDRFHYKVCYHCQEIGHMSDKCPNSSEPPVCLYCGCNHRSKQCPDKKNPDNHNCVLCSKSNIERLANNSHTHNATSLDCPINQREIRRIQNNTDYVSKNVM